MPFISRPKATLPSAVRHGKSCAKSWNTTPRSMPWPVTALPPMRISPAAGDEEAGDDVEQRRLAAAGRADDAEELGVLDIDADILHARHLAAGRVVDERNVADFDRQHDRPS